MKGVLNIQIKAATESGTESFYNETISEDQVCPNFYKKILLHKI